MADINVQDEQGNVHVFPDGSTPEMIAKAMNVKPPAPETPEQAPETTTHKIGRTASDVLQGVGEGAFSTVSNIGKFITDPLVRHIASPEAMAKSDANIKAITRPQNSTQSGAKTAEQVGEFFTPTGLEGEAAAAVPRLLKPIARVGAAAIDTGLKNKAQGGSFTTGAAGGAGGELLGMGAQKVAPIVAETALGVTGRLRGNGRTIGKAILDETRGVNPSTVAQSAGQRIAGLTSELEGKAGAASGAASATTDQAHQVLDNAIARAPRNAVDYTKKLESLRSMLDFNQGAGPQRRAFTPDEVLEMKRGIDKEISSWAPEMRKGVDPVKRQIYRALDSELDRTVPGAQGINQRISSLIPARDRAIITDRNASTVQRTLGRIARPTGALAGAIGGYYYGGPKGALYGLAIPELLSSPTGQMTAARMMRNPAIPLGIGKGLALQLDRSPENPDEEK